MKEENLNQPDYPVINGYVFGIYGITSEKFEKLKNSREMLAIDAEEERLKNGTATEEERMNHEAFLKRWNDAPKDIFTSEHIFGTEPTDRK